MSLLKEIQPIVPVKNIQKSVQFFQEYLGFKIESIQNTYARIRRDNVGLSLVPQGENVGQISCYIWVEDIEVLHKELEPQLRKLPKAYYKPLFEQEYGMKEFHVIDLDNLLLFFGERIG